MVVARTETTDAQHAGKTVIATCAFAKGYIARHPELEEYLAPEFRRR
jgi:predicted GNAT family acetyltransferase